MSSSVVYHSYFEQTVGDADLTLEVNRTVVHPPCPATLAGWPSEAAREVRVCRTR